MSRRHDPENKANPKRRAEIAARKLRRQGDPKFTQIVGPSKRAERKSRRVASRLPGNLPSDSNHAVCVLLRAEKVRLGHPLRLFYENLAANIRDEHRIAQHAAGEI